MEYRKPESVGFKLKNKNKNASKNRKRYLKKWVNMIEVLKKLQEKE